MKLKRDEIRLLAAIAILYPAAVGTGWAVWGPVVTIPALTVIFVALAAIGLGGTRRLRGDLEESLRQTQALLYLNTHLQPAQPFPALGGAALYPDSAAMLVGLINEQQPEQILELGSGVSTLVCAQALKQLGRGHIVSLDHDDHYARITRANLESQGLASWADVRHAPIESVTIDSKEWLWYSTSQLPGDRLIDLLIVDGPPKKIQDLARYPALPLLFGMLAPDCRIVVDDTNRRDEGEIVRRWQTEFPGFEVRTIPFGKGATVFCREIVSLPAGAIGRPAVRSLA